MATAAQLKMIKNFDIKKTFLNVLEVHERVMF